MANITRTGIDFWQREGFTLADAERIQITLPNEITPKATIANPAKHSQGIVSLPAPPNLNTISAKEFLMAQLFPRGLTSTTIAQIMKGDGIIER